MIHVFNLNDMQRAFGSVWYGNHKPTEIRGNHETISRLSDFLRALRPYSDGQSFNGTELKFDETVAPFTLYFHNAERPDDPKMNIYLHVGQVKAPEAKL